MDKSCKRCGVTRAVTEFVVNRSAANGGNVCRPCRRKRDAERREAERERFRSEHAAWRASNREHVRAYARRRGAELRTEVLAAYGNACVCCGEREPAFLTIDHIDGGGTAHRRAIHRKVYAELKRHGFPPGYRVLCWNCNWAHRLSGSFPHQ
jgi:hypothetical protein